VAKGVSTKFTHPKTDIEIANLISLVITEMAALASGIKYTAICSAVLISN